MKLQKNRIKVTMVLVLLIVLNSPVGAYAFEKDQINTWLEQLNDQDWNVRAEAEIRLYYSIKKLEDKEIVEKVKTDLIDLLAREIALKDAGQFKDTTPGGESGEYIANFAERVATFKDVRSIPSLMRYMSIRSVRKTLVEFGDPMAELLLEELEKRDIVNKGTPALVLGEMVKPKGKGYIAKGRTRKKIKQALIKALKESKHPTDKSIKWYDVRAMQMAGTRMELIRALSNFGDPDVIFCIKNIAKEDPYFEDFSKKKNYKGSKKRYMVREEAERVLKQLQANKKEEGIKEIEQKEEKENK